MALDYLKDPAAIYRLSFETARAEADLSGFTEAVLGEVYHVAAFPVLGAPPRIGRAISSP